MLLIFNLVYLFVKWMNIFAFLRRIKARVFVGPFSEQSLIICDFSIDRKFVLNLFNFRDKCINAYFYALIWTILPNNEFFERYYVNSETVLFTIIANTYIFWHVYFNHASRIVVALYFFFKYQLNYSKIISEMEWDHFLLLFVGTNFYTFSVKNYFSPCLQYWKCVQIIYKIFTFILSQYSCRISIICAYFLQDPSCIFYRPNWLFIWRNFNYLTLSRMFIA